MTAGLWFGWKWYESRIDPIGNGLKPFRTNYLEKYDFDSLRQVYKVPKVESLKFEILGNIPEVEARRKLAHSGGLGFTTQEIRFKSEGKWVSGMMNLPVGNGLKPFRTIIMIRGYAEPVGYYVGSGTWKAADEFAKAGYTTISLDFLGYGHSDAESADVLEARFQKVTEVMDLIESVKQLSWVDKNRIGIWAHSNGGQIALSVLEVTGQKYPTALWAPMTDPFPQSLIDTADEGQAKDEAEAFVNLFLKHYDGRRYAFENYYDWIKAPVLIQQGTNDSQVKLEWQTPVAKAIGAELVVYDGADHNMGGKKGEIWKEAVKKDIEFFSINMIQ